MNRKLLFATAALAAAALAACGRNESGGVASQQNEPVNVAQDIAGAATGIGTAAVGAVSTDAYLRDAAIGSMYEIEAARIALQRSNNPEVRRAAEMIIADHTRNSEELKQLISSGQVQGTLPTALDERRQGMLDNLRGASNQDFDKRFLDQQTMAHHEALLLHSAYAKTGSVEPLKQFAARTAPVIQHHVDMVAALDRGGTGDNTRTAGVETGQKGPG